eukprot:UN12560
MEHEGYEWGEYEVGEYERPEVEEFEPEEVEEPEFEEIECEFEMEHHPNCVKLRKVEAEAPDYEDIASDYNEHLTDPYLRAAAQNNEPQPARVQLSSSKIRP